MQSKQIGSGWRGFDGRGVGPVLTLHEGCLWRCFCTGYSLTLRYNYFVLMMNVLKNFVNSNIGWVYLEAAIRLCAAHASLFLVELDPKE